MTYIYVFLTYVIFSVQLSLGQDSGENICSRTTTSIKQYSNSANSLNNTLICSEVTNLEKVLKEMESDIKELIITNSTLFSSELITLKSSFKHLKIQNCFIKQSAMGWIYSLNKIISLSFIECFNHKVMDHSGNSVSALYLKMKPLMRLKHLEVKGCNITDLDVTEVDDFTNLPRLNLSGNAFECSHDYLWLYNLYMRDNTKRRKRIELDHSICFMEKMHENITFQALYTLRNKPFLAVMEYKKEVTVSCPTGCTCEFIGMHTVERPLLSVDCIGLNLTKLPAIIPKGSSRFNFTRNWIEDLSPLYTNKLYEKVSFMDLSYNRISYLDPLNFVQVLKQQPRGVGFNLDHNRLTKFPAAVMLKVFQELKYMPQFFLGHNPWLCTCDYIGNFQKLIYYYLYDIKDARDIRCSENDPYNAGKMVLSVSTRDMCFTEPVFHTLDLINLMLALVLLILISDYVYNYRQYRKHRKLPWIVTKFKC